MKPNYQLRYGPGWAEIWQLPCEVTPHLTRPLRIGGLKGDRLDLVGGMFARWLKKGGLSMVGTGEQALAEDIAVQLGLLCKALAPMRRVERMRQVAEGIDEMKNHEAAYWLGMALYRFNQRRVLSALRLLLTAR